MGVAYKLECKQCGTQFIFSGDSGYGVMPTCVGCGDSNHNLSVVKCPGCQRRFNVKSEEFREQILEEMNWG
ncbi:MAG: hypothetical protein SNF68_08135 [Rikenellaceae bacterium]